MEEQTDKPMPPSLTAARLIAIFVCLLVATLAVMGMCTLFGQTSLTWSVLELRLGRLIAAALVLSRLANQKVTLSGLVETLPTYYTIKSKAKLPIDFKERLSKFEKNIANRLLGRSKLDRRDGMRFDFDRGWLQIRSSNTEPIFRLIVETDDAELSRTLSQSVIGLFK